MTSGRGRRLRGGPTDTPGQVAALERLLADQQAAIDVLRADVHDAARAIEGLAARIDRIDRRERSVQRIRDCETWIAAAPPSSTLITVVMATRDRAALLPRAIDSVRAQTHAAWELLVVDDGSSDGTATLLAAIEEPRVRVLTVAGIGAAPARNRALDVARGKLVTYLDDDNLMLPGWLAAVAWAFDGGHAREVLYGARVHESLSDALPEIEFDPWDPEELLRRNFVDGNTLAHRRELPEARWDPEVPYAHDWDLVLRLTESGPPLALPVRAVLYATSAPGRLGDAPGAAESAIEVVARWRGRRPGGAS